MFSVNLWMSQWGRVWLSFKGVLYLHTTCIILQVKLRPWGPQLSLLDSSTKIKNLQVSTSILQCNCTLLTVCPGFFYGNGWHSVSPSLHFHGLFSSLNGHWIQFLFEAEELVEGSCFESSAEENLQPGSFTKLPILWFTIQSGKKKEKKQDLTVVEPISVNLDCI